MLGESCNELLDKYSWELKDSKANQDENNVQKTENDLAAIKGVQRRSLITRKSKTVVLDKK